MIVTEEQPFPQAFSGLHATFQNAEMTSQNPWRKLLSCVPEYAGEWEKRVNSVEFGRAGRSGDDRKIPLKSTSAAVSMRDSSRAPGKNYFLPAVTQRGTRARSGESPR